MGLTSLPAQLAGILVVGIALAYWFGYGASRWLLPRELLPYRGLLMPSIGLSVLTAVACPLAFLGINTPLMLWILLPLSICVNATALLRAPRSDRLAKREWFAPFAVAVIASGLALAPLFAYGYITITGYNVDSTVWVPQAEYAKQFGLSSAQIRTIASPFAVPAADAIDAGAGVGASLWLSMLSQLVQCDAFFVFAPALALWHGLSFLSVFVLYRVSFRLPFWTSILALAALVLNGIRLLIPLDNFAPHTFALALLPLVWMATGSYFETGARRAWVLAALTLGAQISIYPQALPFYVLPFGLLWLWKLRDVNAAREQLVRWLQIGALSALLCPTAYWTLYHSIVPEVGMVTNALGGTIETFIPLPEGFGIYALHLMRNPDWVPWDAALLAVWNALAWGGAVILGVFFIGGVYASLKTERRLLAASGIALAVLSAWMVFIENFAYGFFKTLATSLFVFIALIAFGAQWQMERLGALPKARHFRFAMTAALVFLFALGALGMFSFQSALAQRAPVVTRKLIQLANSRNILTPRASIYLSLTRRSNPRMYWAAYLLRDHPLFGNGQVAYSTLRNAQAGAVYDYALLNRGENPADNDLPDMLVWEDRWTLLYARR
jgi:hypothetical protein